MGKGSSLESSISMAAPSVEVMVHGYHVYKSLCFITVEEPCRREHGNTQDLDSCKRYSSDLSHSGLKIPCLLKFEGYVAKAEKLSEYALSASVMYENGPPEKKRKRGDATGVNSTASYPETGNVCGSKLSDP